MYVYIIELIEGYDFDRNVERLRVTSTLQKAIDWVNQEYPLFKQVTETEWVGSSAVDDRTARIYISMETVF